MALYPQRSQSSENCMSLDIKPFSTPTDVYRLLECWEKRKPGNCIQMNVIPTIPSFQVSVVIAVVSTGPSKLFLQWQVCWSELYRAAPVDWNHLQKSLAWAWEESSSVGSFFCSLAFLMWDNSKFSEVTHMLLSQDELWKQRVFFSPNCLWSWLCIIW